MRFEPVSLLTARLVLRPSAPGDEAALAAGLGDRAVQRWLETVPHPYTLDHARDWVARSARERDAGFMQDFAITLADGGAVIGGIAFTPSRREPAAELGYWLARPHWGKGYGGEALARVVRHATEECMPRFTRLSARVAPDNTASRRMLARLGFVENGVSVDNGVERLRYER
ncbi:MAG: GNAT family N-acetyltransferase [Planctomycetota bacterium]|nr:GNAT family N-acetyltransferase [Planctomycetota bacterium]